MIKISDTAFLSRLQTLLPRVKNIKISNNLDDKSGYLVLTRFIGENGIENYSVVLLDKDIPINSCFEASTHVCIQTIVCEYALRGDILLLKIIKAD